MGFLELRQARGVPSIMNYVTINDRPKAQIMIAFPYTYTLVLEHLWAFSKGMGELHSLP